MADHNVSLFNSTTDNYNLNETNEFVEQQKFFKDALRFSIYTTGRSLEIVIGLIGNILTLIIIKRRKSRSNGHILMVYLAISDLLVTCSFFLSSYTFATTTVIEKGKTWGTICKVKEFMLCITNAGNIFSYVLLSVDR